MVCSMFTLAFMKWMLIPGINSVSIMKSMPRGLFACCSAHFFSFKNSPHKPPEPSAKHLLDPLRTRLCVSVSQFLCICLFSVLEECLFLDKCLNACTCLCACSNCCVSVSGRLKDSLPVPLRSQLPWPVDWRAWGGVCPHTHGLG